MSEEEPLKIRQTKPFDNANEPFQSFSPTFWRFKRCRTKTRYTMQEDSQVLHLSMELSVDQHKLHHPRQRREPHGQATHCTHQSTLPTSLGIAVSEALFLKNEGMFPAKI